MKKVKKLLGYRLHDARIAHSGGADSMRSIKYELVDPAGINDLSKDVAQLVRLDNKMLYGNIGLGDYLDWRKNITDQEINSGAREASFLGLWIKALSLGVVFSKQAHLREDFNRLIGVKTESEIAYNLLSDYWKEKIEPEKWSDWWKCKGRPAKLENVFAREDREKDDIKEIINRYNANQNKKTDLEFRCQLFNIDAQKIPREKSELNQGISWAIDPKFPAENFAQISDRTSLLDKIILYYKDKGLDSKADRELSHFLGLYGVKQGYIYGFLGNFFTMIKSGDLSAHAKNLAEVFGFSNSEQIIIEKRLNQLRKYAEKIPAKPKMVNSWAKYNNDFGGTLESWYSNKDSKMDESKQQIKELRKLIDEIYQSLSDDNSIKNKILAQTIEFIDQSTDIDRAFTVELESYLTVLRTELNLFWQTISDKKLAQKTTDWQKRLRKRIQASPLFFGENKIQLWEEIYNLKTLIRQTFRELFEVVKPIKADFEISDKQVDKLAQLYNRIKDDGDKKIIVTLENIAKKLDTDFAERYDPNVSKEKNSHWNFYFLSPFSRYKKEKVKILDFSAKSLGEIFNSAQIPDLADYVMQNLENPTSLRDATQLLKILASAQVSQSDFNTQREVVKFTSLLQGYSALVARRNFITRYSIQATNGEQSVLAIGNDLSRKGNPTERYFYAFPRLNDTRRVRLNKIALPKKLPLNYPDEMILSENKEFSALKVSSSRYQIQFLDWFFGAHKSKKTTLKTGGAFLVSEFDVSLNWQSNHPKAEIAKVGRIFVSQPFTIIAKNSKPTRKSTGKYIGVDIGEYGLAWVFIEVNGKKIQVRNKGFISSLEQQALKKSVNNLRKEQQVRQTFSSPNNKISRIRESLIGYYKNELERLSVEFNARLSFEYEVSGFEIGGQKIAKIYNSIKRGSIRRQENALENQMSWGKNPFAKIKTPNDFAEFNRIFGFETTASGTSQFCTKCKRWSSLAIEDNQEYKLETYNDNLFKTKIADGEIRLFYNSDQSESIIKGKNLKKFVYKAMRPNEGGAGFEIIKRNKGSELNEITKIFGKDKVRGNIGLYVCPYTDCHHISDADLQAAFNIAVRGKIKDDLESEKSVKLTKDYLTKTEAKLQFSPIELDLSVMQF